MTVELALQCAGIALASVGAFYTLVRFGDRLWGAKGPSYKTASYKTIEEWCRNCPVREDIEKRWREFSGILREQQATLNQLVTDVAVLNQRVTDSIKSRRQ